ncbi:MYXO-CTERM sorting domain-containing protein [Nannocystis radixulma]|uniref:MYXO-CTERM sorting domain-containing protein n=1 Tax=Nannocystis radixulma TaxID=2995305 RepID=A0ABT5B3T7_9BACT|nr:MYXO-CTERM sorting domain-containing protein [Nannocystis radixulma]MDC0668760.1 MYXO-CTERM sorting domain-containing protein [Nannocystis radixulma]
MVRSHLHLVAAALLLALRPEPVAACKPPQFVAERLDFALVGARKAGQPMALDRLPPTLRASSTPYGHMLVRDIGVLKLMDATSPLPAATERYLRRQRRLARPVCAILVYREPATPGRYTPDHDIHVTSTAWTELWPQDVPGIVEFTADRTRMLVTIDRPGDLLELEYRLTGATFSSCDVTGEAHPPVVLAVLALALRRRRR